MLELDAVTGTFVANLASPSLGSSFSPPGAVAPDGRHVWVTSPGGGSVTELDAATGALVRVLKGHRYRFNQSHAAASDGLHVWVVNSPQNGGGSVIELDAATGALVKVLDGSAYGFNYPEGIAWDGARVWVANANSDSVTEFPRSQQ